MPIRLIDVSAIFLVLAGSNVVAQSATIERTAQAQSGKDAKIGVYVNVRPDCKSGPLPTIRLIQPSEHGKVTVKKGNLNATNYKQCLALDVPAYVAVYRSANDFSGTERQDEYREVTGVAVQTDSLSPCRCGAVPECEC